MQHVCTSPYYPQSNGKIECWHAFLKGEAIRPGTPISLEDARRVTATFVDHYNDVRLHSAFGYVAPRARLEGRDAAITKARDANKLAAAREARAVARQRLRAMPFPAEVESLQRRRPDGSGVGRHRRASVNCPALVDVGEPRGEAACQ